MKPIKLHEAKCIMDKYQNVHYLKFEKVNLNMLRLEEIENGRTAIILVIYTFKERLENSFEIHIDDFFKKFIPLENFAFDCLECLDN